MADKSYSMTRFFLFLILPILLSACDATVTDYVKSSRPGNIGNPNSPLQANGPMALKVSPGQLSGIGGGISAQGNITTTNRKLSATDISAQVTISRVRTSP